MWTATQKTRQDVVSETGGGRKVRGGGLVRMRMRLVCVHASVCVSTRSRTRARMPMRARGYLHAHAQTSVPCVPHESQFHHDRWVFAAVFSAETEESFQYRKAASAFLHTNTPECMAFLGEKAPKRHCFQSQLCLPSAVWFYCVSQLHTKSF